MQGSNDNEFLICESKDVMAMDALAMKNVYAKIS